MQVQVQVVTISDEGQEITQDIACVERQELTPRDAWPLPGRREGGAPSAAKGGGRVTDGGVSPPATRLPAVWQDAPP
jgi:hypothetical protein